MSYSWRVLSREAAQDRSPGWSEAEPWVKNPNGGSPGRGVGNKRMLTPLQQSAVWRAFIDARNKSTRHSKNRSFESPSFQKNIPCVFNKFHRPGIDVRNSSAMLIAVNQSDDKQCGTIPMEWRTRLCKGKKAPNPYISCRKLQKLGLTN